ncbi:TRIO and F-actin-binding protein isoform X2 [Sagmatias obliquidens]|uniref:TRIO and F-actin-binding protein isoform X2 n=1 Tax=Sagmatias obliquidens TaxID=3371155 RepID=UPI000F43F626|nr:TRIO and F-actin-binding protein isoform X2 [Lagenorhynchus obliquidens]
MEGVAGNAPCDHFEANVLAQRCCQNCFHPEEAHRARHQEPGSPPSAEAPYCDLPRRPAAPEDPLGASTSNCQSVVGSGLGPGPERGPSTGLPAEGLTATPRSQEPEAAPYLEGLASSLCGNFNESPDSGTSSSPDCEAPDDTSDSSSVDWDTVERQEEAPSGDKFTVMIPRKPQEGPRADSARRAPPLLTRSPVGGDTAGQRKEGSGGGNRSAGQHWAKLRGESAYFLERHRSALTPVSPATPQSGARSTTPQASSLHRSASTQLDTSRASSPPRLAQRDNPRTSSTQQDTPRTSSTQRNTPRASSPSRVAQRDNPRTSSTQQDTPRASSTQQNTPRPSSPSRVAQRDNPRTSSTQQDTPKTSSTQRNTPRASSPSRVAQRDNPRTSSTQQDTPKTSSTQRNTPRASSPSRIAQRDNPRTSSTQQDTPRASSTQQNTPRASSPSRVAQRDNPRTSSTQRNNPQVSFPPRATQQDNSRASSTQQDSPQAPVPTCTPQRDNPRPSCIQQNTPRTSSTQRDNPKTSCAQRDNPKSSSSRRENPGSSSSQGCTQRDNPGPSSPRRSSQRNNPRNSSPHRTNKDIPWASFPLRPTQGDGPRTSSPSCSKQSEVPWASIALRPTQSDRPQTSSPIRPAQRDSSQRSSSPTQHNSPSRATSSSHPPGHHSAFRTSSPLHPATRGAPQTSPEPSQPPCPVCIGHRDAPRASSPPRYLQHDPFPFFPDPHASESESPHHDPPYMPPAVCIGHRDAPRASSPPRHTQFDPFPFLPDTSDAENQSAQHEPPQFPPTVCIGHRDAPRASSPPRQAPEPSLLFQDLPRASTESLVPSTDSLHERLHIPSPVCIGHRDAPSFSSPPRQAPEPSLFFQDPTGTSMESLAPSTDSLRGSPVLPPQVCIGHRDAPRASSPPRHPPSDLALLAPSPPPGSSGGSRGSAPPGETRHNLEREEYTVLADLPPPRRLAQREPGPQCSNGGRTRSPGRAEVERLFGQERRKSEAPGAFQTRDEGRSQRPSQVQSQPLRRQSSPALSREVTKPLAKQAEPARRSRAEPPHPRSPERRPEGERRLQGSSPPPRTSARTPEREQRTESPLERGRAGPRRPLGGQQSLEGPPGSGDPHGHLERGWGRQEGPGLGGWLGLGGPRQGAARAPEETWRGPPRESEESWKLLAGPPCHRGQAEAWEEPPSAGPWEPSGRPAQRGWGSLQELSSPHQPMRPPESSRAGPGEFSKPQRPETTPATGWGAEGACPHLRGPERQPELDWRDLVGLLMAPREGAWTHSGEPTLASTLPRLDWEGLLELLQAQLPRRDSAGHWGGPGTISPGTKGTLELEPERHTQSEGGAGATLVNGYSPGQWPQSSAQPPSPAGISTQWPKTKVTSGPETSTMAGLEETGQLRGRSPAEGPSSLQWEFQSKEPEESEGSRGQDSLTDQKQADSPDLLNFKKGWMSILDEPGEWKKHWFVLTDSSLKYYRDSTAEEADELDGEIDLRCCTDVTEYAVQRNYGFQIHTKDAVYTLSAMTSGIRRNWIEALRKTVRPTSAPDVTKLSDCNKENTLHSYGTPKGSLKAGEQRAGSEVIGWGGPRKADGQRQSLDYVELSPLTQGSLQRARTPARALDRPAKQEELERDLAQRSEERRKWFQATDSRATETQAGEGPRRGLGAPLTEDQQNRLSEEIEKKWQELEKLPLRENKRVPLTALLNQSRGERRGAPSDSHEALEREVQSLRAQLEAWRLQGEARRLQGEASHGAPKSQEDGHIPPGYISQRVDVSTVPIFTDKATEL